MEAIKSTVETFLTNAGKETRDDTESYKYSASDAAAEAKEEVKDAAQSAKEKASNAADSVKQSAKETADAAERKTNEVSAKANNATTSSASASSTKTTGAARAGAVTGDVTVDKEVVEEAPVVHERVHKTIVDENQTIIDREHDVDHYKKKIQPIAVEQNQGTARQAGEETHAERKVDLEDDAATKAKLAAEDAKLKSTKDVDVKHEQVQKKDIVNEKEHHHLHERVQPVIEKDVYQKQVNKNVDHVHESVRDKAVVEETEVLPTKKQSEVNN